MPPDAVQGAAFEHKKRENIALAASGSATGSRMGKASSGHTKVKIIALAASRSATGSRVGSVRMQGTLKKPI